jgi:MHS family proline/betaine transporter-like MFS transporter
VTGLSLAYNISVPIFGGFAPFAAVSLIALTGSALSPSYYVMFGALLSLSAMMILRRRIELPERRPVVMSG